MLGWSSLGQGWGPSTTWASLSHDPIGRLPSLAAPQASVTHFTSIDVFRIPYWHHLVFQEYIYEVFGDVLSIGQVLQRRGNNAFLGVEKPAFHTADWKTTKTRTVRTVSSRVTLTLYVGESFTLTAAMWLMRVSPCTVPPLTHCLHGLTCLRVRVFSQDGVEIDLPSSWTRENVNTKHKAFERQLL